MLVQTQACVPGCIELHARPHCLQNEKQQVAKLQPYLSISGSASLMVMLFEMEGETSKTLL